MKELHVSRLRLICCAILIGAVFPSVRPLVGQEPSAPLPAVATENEPLSPKLQFSFQGAPWREVAQWIADQSNLALHVGDLPTGSFTYSDPSSFSPDEAIDRINLFLLAEGYTLVRSGKLLSVINLADPRSLRQLDVLATLVPVEQLAQSPDQAVVRCIFPLGEISADEVVQELSALKLMSPPTVLARTNQLLITDTAAKLRSVQAILSAFKPEAMNRGMVVKSFPLEHVVTEDVLTVARPHLGLATGEMIGIDISLSSDVPGKTLFVTGAEDKVQLIEGLITAIDQPKVSTSTNEGTQELRSYAVEGGNVDTVYNVLQTMLAGKSVRLSIDQAASSVVALAAPAIQKEIADTISQLQSSAAEFEVIPLKTVDPYFAISLLEQMLSLPSPLPGTKGAVQDAPKIDADPGNRRLFVRGKKHQIEQVKKILEGLDASGHTGQRVVENDSIRILPYRGKQAELLVETAAKFWRDENPIILFPARLDDELEQTERVAGEDPADGKPTANPAADEEVGTARLLTAVAKTNAPAIRCQQTPRGLLVQSEDTEALTQFEEFIRTIAGPVEPATTPPIVFYLKHTRVEDALRMLGELIDGGEAAKENVSGTLVNSFVPSNFSGSLASSIVTSQDGTTTMMAGAITVVADSRLNRLIAQGTADDIKRIEQYLKIIDKDTSITSIETYGSSHVIELENTKASEVAAAIREAFSQRIAGSSSSNAAPQAGSPQQPTAPVPVDQDSEGKPIDPKKVLVMQPPRNLEPKMTIALHEPSNSLIVTAPDQLFAEVEQLVKRIDSRGEEAVEVLAPINGELVGAVLQQVLLGQVAETSKSRNSSSKSTSSSSSSRSKSSR